MLAILRVAKVDSWGRMEDVSGGDWRVNMVLDLNHIVLSNWRYIPCISGI